MLENPKTWGYEPIIGSKAIYRFSLLGIGHRANIANMAFFSRQCVKAGFLLSFVAMCVGLSACSTTPPVVRKTAPDLSAEIYDPIEDFNRGIYKFNEGADKYFISPLAKIYDFILPKFVRKGVTNVARNLSEPVIFVNEVLQLDVDDAADSLGRFAFNSTIGLGGLIDVVERDAGISQQREDFGQTLATYGVPSGPYIVLPLLGPSTMRDGIGRIADGVTNPLRWVNFDGDQGVQIGRRVAKGLDSRIKAEPFLENVRASADPYVNLRGLYTQNRLNNIHEDADPFDGFADIDDDFDDGESDDGFADFE